MKIILIIILSVFSFGLFGQNQLMFGDTTRLGKPFSKDPHVIHFQGRYIMYYSIPPKPQQADMVGWAIGIAQSKNLNDWTRIGEIGPAETYESKGLCAPCAIVRNDTVHLFYQTYGNREKDAICHAWSTDGIHFVRNKTNPVFSPTGAWNCGRAIDAEVYAFNGQYLRYFATRTPDYKTQIIGVAKTTLQSDFSKQSWTQAVDAPVLKPEFPWEGECTEGASIVSMNGYLYMFYAGAYNNQPQQVGVARSKDGITWEKLSNKPFLPNGDRGSWNYCESGHPHIFKDTTGKTVLFYQGNNDFGKSWLISSIPVLWKNNFPVINKK